jgi:oxalate decarboxylase
MRPGRGGTDPGPRNIPIEMQNPDIFIPPPTDHGTVANLKFPFSASHMRLERGGWTRQVTERELGISKEIDETPLGGPSGMLVQDQPRC